MERFLHAGRFSVASIYGPISYPPLPLIVLKNMEGAPPAVAVVGSLKSVDPDRIILKKIILTGIINMAMEMTSILLAAQSQDGYIHTAVEGNLKQFQEQNLPHFLLALSVELSNEQKPPESRRLAGILLKNSLDAKDSIRKEQLGQKWISMDLTIKFQVKESLLKTLGSSVSEARRTSSQVIAKVASI